jgi:hypothetical protein
VRRSVVGVRFENDPAVTLRRSRPSMPIEKRPGPSLSVLVK